MFASEILFYNLMMISGKKWGGGNLTVYSEQRVITVYSEQRVSTKYDNGFDVLLRKRA